MKKIKTLTGYTAQARYLATLTEEPVGYVVSPAEIATPYSYSPTRSVYATADGRLVIILEVAHRRFEVYAVEGAAVHATEEAAEAAFLAPRAVRFETRALLAGAYKGKGAAVLAAVLTHTLDTERGVFVCGKVKPESAADRDAADVHAAPTCMTCTDRDPRFA